MAKPKKSFDISDAAKKDSYNIRAESVSSTLLSKGFKRISRIEKIFYLVLIATALIFAISTIYMKTKVMESEQKLTDIQTEISEKKVREEELNQQIQELSRSDRIIKIAEKDELRLNDNNIRKANK